MDNHSTDSSTLGGPSQYHTGKSKRPANTVSSFEQLNDSVSREIKFADTSNSECENVKIPLRVDPAEVTFDQVELGVRYVMNIAVRNVTKSAQRIRFSVPKTSAFSINYIPAGAVAPGLDVVAEIECQLDDNSENYIFTDIVVVSMGKYKVEIPLVCRKPCPDIVFNPFLDFGLVPEKQVATSYISFENAGSAPAQVIFKPQKKSKLVLEPMRGTIDPGSLFSLCVRHDCKELGAIRELVEVSVNGLPQNMILDVSGQVVNQKLSLLAADGKGSLEQVDFGTLFYGQSKEIQAVLVNNGPVQVNYTISYPDEGESDGGPPDRQLAVFPSDGTMDPFSQIALTLRFTPVAPSPKKGFASQFVNELSTPVAMAVKANIDVLDMGDQEVVGVTMLGAAVIPTYKLSPTTLRFGTCPANDRRDILMTLQNTSPIPMKFNFSSGAQFNMVPSSGIANPGQSKSIVACFVPCQLGTIKKISKFSVENGLRTSDVRIVGECIASDIKKKTIGGLDKVPDDFKKSYKFVDPTEMVKQTSTGDLQTGSKFHRVQPWDSQEFLSSTSWDEVYEGGEQPQSSTNDPVTYSLQELQRRSHHKATYTDFVRKSHAERNVKKHEKIRQRDIGKGRLDPRDPDGIDMGMERGLGDGPLLKVPVADEPLWLANRSEKGDKKKFQFDENRLILKKARDTPSTQAEQRDCATELTAEQLRGITASHKIINFGKVCVNSVNVKNFAVTNELQQMVIVKLGSLESELRQSKPMAQIVAANGTVVGFDIQFVCRQVCKYKKTFSWTINDTHNFKVTVLADVVPIEVVLDKQILSMEFSVDSMEKSHTDKVVMTNPGNAVAEFVWGNRGAFKCVPEQGNLHPGQSMVVSIIWTPEPNLSNREDISLIVTGGTEQVLSLTGLLSEGQIAFDDKKLNIGTMAVGAERKVMTTLKNTGSSPAAFFFGDIPLNYHIEIKPEKGKLNPDESIDVCLFVKPLSRTHYDNKSISVTPRGGKPVSIKLAGEAIVPKVHLEESQFCYGHVVTGSKELKPFSLVNSGTIDSVLFLDFNSYPDFKPILGNDENSLSSTTIFEDNEGNVLEHLRQNEIGDKRWRLVVRAGVTMRGFIKFSPTTATLHSFKLPLTFQGLPADTSLARPVTAEGLLSRLHVSAYTIDFHDRVVARDPSSRMSYFEEVTFKNVDMTAGLTYEIKEIQDEPTAATSGKSKSSSAGMPVDEQPVFFVSPTRGDLAPGDTSTMRVTFLPKCNGDFFKILQIYISGQPDSSRPYFTLTVRGSGVYPRLSFSESRLMLPAVPLNVTSRCQCTVFNQGYDNIELKYRVSPAIPVPLEITFPDGNELGLTRAKTTMIIAAKSDRPESWTGKIEFYDSDGEKFFIEVSGCSDSSIMTVYPFVRDYSDRYGFLGLDGQPIRFCTKKELAFLKAQEVRQKALNRRKALESQNSISSLPSDSASAVSSARKSRVVNVSEDSEPIFRLDEEEGVDVTRIPSAEDVDSEGDIKMLLKWFNAFICRKQFDVDNFLECIVGSNGDVVVDCLEQLSGKKVGALLSPSQSRMPGGGDSDHKNDGESASLLSNRLNHVNKLMTKYVNLLQFLTRSGCLVLHISPSSLLDVESCVLSREIELKKSEGVRLTQAMLKDRRDSWERNWQVECSQSWSQILFQAFKIFVLSRITYKDYIETPGVVVQSALASESKDAKKEKSRGNKSEAQAGGAQKKKSKGPKCPPELVASNIFSQAEAVVLTWVAYHQLRAGRLPDAGSATHPNTLNPRMPSMNRRIVDPDTEFSDFFTFCQLIHSHLPDATSANGTLAGYTFTEPAEKDSNFERFTAALNAVRINFDVNVIELSSSSRCMIMMAAHLFLNLPHLLPKTTIEFKGSLSTPIPKMIELKNPSKKMVSYDVTLEGHSDFNIGNHTISLEPGSVTGFNVSCTPSFSKPVQGRLTFWGIREGGVGGSNIVFDLITKVTDRPPLNSIRKNVHMFEHDMTEIEVTNPFDQSCTFSVQILQQHVTSSMQQLFGHQAKTASTRRKNSVSGTNQVMQALLNEVSASSEATARDDEEDDAKKVFQDPCWCNDVTISLGANETKKIIVHSLPFQLGTCTCQIVLIEPSIGEFCYELILNVGLPKPAEELNFENSQLGEGDAIQKILRVSSSNTPFEKAIVLATDNRLPLNRRAKARIAMQNMNASTISNEETGQSQFAVEIDNTYFNTQKEFGLVCNGSGGATTGRVSTGAKKYAKVLRNSIEPYAPSESSANSLPFSFFPEKAGMYRAMVVLYSLSNQQDVRVLSLCAKITPSMTELSLMFTGPARQKVVQEIPLKNESEHDWNLQAIIQGRGFTVPKSVSVPVGKTVSFPVSFQGPQAGQYEATLFLKNTQNAQDSFEFKLRGEADDPLAEAALVYKCRARHLEKFSIDLPSPPGDPVYTVETDLQYLSGADEFSGNKYDFSVNCPVGGIMTGSITFHDKNSDYMVWYTLDIEVTSPAAESTIEAEAEVRKAIAIEISLDNPTDHDLSFDVVLEGDGLLGDNTFVLHTNSSKSANSYELIYSPLKAGNFIGSITFMNDIVGEFWYKVILVAHPARATEVDTIECMVGLSKERSVAVENPLDVPIILTASIGDVGHFSVSPETIALAPYAQSSFDVVFCPSSFNETVSTDIVLSNEKLGDLLYTVSGKGLLPGIMPVVNIAAPMGEIGSHTILFRNPFPYPLPIDVILTEEKSSRAFDDEHEHQNVFALLLRKSTGIVVAANSTLQVAISFSPEKLGDYHATVEFRSSVSGRNLLWCSPVCGIAEAGIPQVLPKLSTACKTSLLKEINIPLDGLLLKDMAQNEELNLQDFSVEVRTRDPAQKPLITRTFRIQPLSVVGIDNSEDANRVADFAIRYRLLFEPLRVFRADLEVIVVCRNKGRWRAEIHLEALDPEPDDTITLQAPVGEIDKVAFRLTNRFLGYSPYEAYFTARSSPHFTVSPSSGVLAPFGSTEGTQFVVSYAPKEYGMRDTATLIVSTAEAQWNYKITGTYPDFFIDRSAVKSKVNSGRG